MNQKEVSEIRRRLVAGKNSISRIYGCYVNTKKEIISYLDESLGSMPELEVIKYMELLKKTLSGSLGKNLIDIVFSTQQVMDSQEHRLLMSLRSSIKDSEARNTFYQKIIDSLEMDNNYLLLLAGDTYDVAYRSKDGELQAAASDTVFSYIICAVCPVVDGKHELGYFSGENEFHGYAASQIVSAPELGFMFPAFDNRSANIHNALFYSKNSGQIHQEFIDAVFRTEAPMSAEEQKAAFQTALTEALETNCSFDVVQSVHEQIRERIVQHKESKNPDSLEITARELSEILKNNGIPEEQIQTFQEKCSKEFGEGAALNPLNIIDSGKFELITPQIKVSVDPQYSYMLETKLIGGRKYILIPADEGVEVNGLDVTISD